MIRTAANGVEIALHLPLHQHNMAMILAQSTYGITIPIEAVSVIIVVVVVYIISIWWKGFLAKPDTLTARLDAFISTVNSDVSNIRIELNNLKNEIKNNSDADHKERISFDKRLDKLEAKLENLQNK